VQLDSYADTGLFTAVELVNEVRRGADDLPAIARILAVDPPSVARLGAADVPGFAALAHRLYEVFGDLHAGDVDTAAGRLNDLLADHPARPHLAKEDGRWRLHHHPVDASVVSMWTSICAEAMARLIGAGYGERLGICAGTGCDRVFLDTSKNGSRRFCSTTCQNRVKAAAFRQRHGAGTRALERRVSDAAGS
jgi:predicted RNA-binding Zn ribbon-like protein